MTPIAIFKKDHVLNLGNLIKTPVISVGIFHKKQECLIDSGASISVISESCVPKSYHIDKCFNQIRDLSGRLNILGQIFIEIKINDIKTVERLVVIFV